MNDTAMRLSVCMIVRDEEASLPACFDSLVGVADELVVVDTGSKDGTVKLARDRGARVIETEWTGDFSRARNLGLAAARGAWSLVFDADETLPPASRERIRAIVEGEPNEAFALITLNPDPTGHCARLSTMRLVPTRPEVRYQFPIHEDLYGSLAQAGIPTRSTDIEILHSGYADEATLRQKAVRNGAIIARALAQPNSSEAERHLRYYYAVSFYDAGDWSRAAKEFEHCIEISEGPRSKLAGAARVWAAECHFALGQLDATASCLPERLDSAVHPQALWLGAQVAQQRRDAASAQACLEKILTIEDGAFLPPVSLAAVKVKTLNLLGQRWAGAGRKDLGVQILRLALEIKNRIRANIGRELGTHYAAIVAGAR